MINRLNLASRPFRNRTLPWAVTVAVMCVSLVTLVLITRDARQTSWQADAIEADVVGKRAEADVLQKRAAQVMRSLSPDELQSLEAAHRMVDQKRFSWSRLFADLEAALPANVRVEQVSVTDVLRSGGQTYADLEMTIVSRTASDVTRMINEMSRAGVFDAEPLSQDMLDAKQESGVRFTLRVNYRPRAFVVNNTTDETARGGASADGTESMTAATRRDASSPQGGVE
ncbi:MAG: hypothetical protein WKF30_14875 [Pyrinomonadaceae bacterium]